MSRIAKENKIWFVAFGIVVAIILVFMGWQRLEAQGAPPPPMPPMPGGGPGGMPGAPSAMPMPGGAPAMPGVAAPSEMGASQPAVAASAPTPSAPVVSLSSVMPGAVKVQKTKNWDGRVTEMLRFKYQLTPGRVLTVHLPGAYKSQKMTKEAWSTLFQVFSMDYEAKQASRESLPEVSAEQMSALMATIGQGSSSSSALSPAAPAMSSARTGLPMMGGAGLPPMPMALPGMP